MSDVVKTREQLRADLAAMRRKLEEIESCRLDLEKTRTRYEKLLDAAPDAMIFVGPDRKIRMANAQTEQLFGYGPDELVGRELDMLVPERFRQHHAAFVQNYFADPRPRAMGSNLRIYGLKKDGTEFRGDISLSPMLTEEGLLVTAAVRDVTERIEAQEQIERNFHIQKAISAVLRMSLEPLSLDEVVDRTLDLILSVPHLALGGKGSISLVEGNPSFLALKAQRGMSEEQLQTCSVVPMGKCLCGRAAESCELLFTDCVDERHELRFNESFPHGHYCVPMVANGKPLGNISVVVPPGHRRNGIEEDFLSSIANTLAMVIDRHRSRQERESLQEQLAQSEKLAALGRITANVAHELRNPLTAIGGFARRLQRGLPDALKEKEYAGFIASEVAGLEKILRNVLDFSGASTLNRTMQDLRQITDEVLMLYDDAIREKTIVVRKEYSALPEAAVDREHAKAAIGNIVSNAIEALGRGGELTVTTAVETVDGRPYAALSFRDNGEGIAPGLLDKIFEPFFTTKIAQRGVGLGLPIAKKIMEDHGGFMRAASTPGQGATFSLFFPLSEKQGG